MNDLRHDPADPTDAHAPDLRERTRLNPRDLTTVLGAARVAYGWRALCLAGFAGD